jgi:hypothetical protein
VVLLMLVGPPGTASSILTVLLSRRKQARHSARGAAEQPLWVRLERKSALRSPDLELACTGACTAVIRQSVVPGTIAQGFLWWQAVCVHVSMPGVTG